MKENINVLDEINKGATMGMNAIHFVLDKIEDEDFKQVLEKDYQKYQLISDKIKEIYPKYNSSDNPHETSMMNKMMTWSGVEMKTMNDKSNSKIAELLLQGTNMGIIEGRKIYNHKEMDEEVKNIVKEYVEMQEESVETLKKYL